MAGDESSTPYGSVGVRTEGGEDGRSERNNKQAISSEPRRRRESFLIGTAESLF